MSISGGRPGRISDIRSLTRSETSSAFSPFSMTTMPLATSPRPPAVTAPLRCIAPSPTSAMSARSTGTPSSARTTTRSRSSTPVRSPIPRTVKRSSRASMNPPLNARLLSPMAWKTSRRVRSYSSSASGRTITSNCWVRPPHEFTSLTPGTERSRVRTSQSWTVLFAIGSSPVTTYW